MGISIRTSVLLSGKRDSNSRPSAWEADALPTELLPHCVAKVGQIFFTTLFFTDFYFTKVPLPISEHDDGHAHYIHGHALPHKFRVHVDCIQNCRF